uniref:Protein kinase domain-containing protein n=1 Tax=Panagrolaimus sp. JU765 TaxID=591449 RepID=A0AC34RIS6_9BILA
MTASYFLFLLFIPFCWGQHDHQKNTLKEFVDDRIRGLAQYRDILGILLENRIQLERLSPGNSKPLLEEVGKINLAGLVSGQDTATEFKFINESLILICTKYYCEVCKGYPESACYSISFGVSGAEYSTISAAFVDNKIHIRAVRLHGNASIFIFEPRYQANSLRYDLVRHVEDLSLMQDLNVVDAFSTSQHTFFVGSATRIDLPMVSLGKGKRFIRNNTEIRISRICNNDKTDQLDSRIDIVLSCDGIHYNDVNYPIRNSVTASLYNPDNDELYVAFKHTRKDSTSISMICQYSFNKIQQMFDHTWEKCQSIKDSHATKLRCKQADNYAKLPEECFMYTWQLNIQQPFCEAFNDLKTGQIDNCNLHESSSMAKRYGWLENFKPVIGKVVYQSSSPVEFIELRHGLTDDTLFALNSQNGLERLHLNENEKLSWYPALSGNRALEIDETNNIVIFADPRFMHTINYLAVSCQGLYSNCSSIPWSDPLDCAFCSNANGGGIAINNDKLICNGTLMRNVCPPQLSKISGNGKYIIEGIGLDNLTEPRKVTVCGKNCPITTVTSIYLFCDMDQQHSSCEVTYTGRLNDEYPVFTLKRSLSDNEGGATTSEAPSTHKEMKWLRYSAYAAAVFLLVGAVAFLFVCKTRISQKLQRKARERYNPVSGDIPLDPLPSRTDSMPIDPFKLKIEQLKWVKEIGKGNSAVVKLARFYRDLNDPQNYQEVAVKELYDLGNFSEAMKEINMMKICQHPNIVTFIGWIQDVRLMIVTEYMSGGSVHDFLRNENSKPTIGQCFNFIEQILDGMVYLSHQHVIHRDLATRNCLLNGERDILKISDFGLSRQTDINYIYVSVGDQRLPYRWLSIEILNNCKKFNIKSDVWAFGVVVWELFTRASLPYAGMNSYEEVKKFLEEGYRLERPQFCPEDLYDVVQTCWDALPENRPTFDALQIRINDILKCHREAFPEKMQDEYERPRSCQDYESVPQPSSSSVTVDV